MENPALKGILVTALAPTEVKSKFSVLKRAVSLHVFEIGPIFFQVYCPNKIS